MCFEMTFKKNTAYLIKNAYSRKVLSGLDIDDGIIILGDKKIYFIDARYFYEVKDLIVNEGFTPILYESEQTIKSFVKENKIKTLYIDFDTTTLTEYDALKKLGVKLKDGGPSLRKSRSVKSQTEIDKIAKSCSIIEEALFHGISMLKLGVTENTI